MTVLHCVAEAVAPRPGGLEQSVPRIARALAGRGYKTFIHTLAQPSAYRDAPGEQDGVWTEDLSEDWEFLLAPFRHGTAQGKTNQGDDMRARLLGLHNRILRHQAHNPGDRHVVISFYASGAGFVAQMAATRLGLPHIASFRGTDFARDVLSNLRHSWVRFVAENATQIVTTNHEQRDGLSAMFRVQRPIRTIYNSLDNIGTRPYWKPSLTQTVRFVSDTGLSSKKATHLLLRAAGSLLDKGIPISLTVVGGILSSDAPGFWEDTCRDYQNRYPGRFLFHGHQPPEEIDGHLLAADAYCSASLSEGCSLSHIRALTIGIPMVATACGTLPEVATGCRHVWLSPPGDWERLAHNMEVAARAILAGQVSPDRADAERWRTCFSAERERDEWTAVVDSIDG